MQITDQVVLEAALAAPEFLLLKHSLVCPVSERAFKEYRAFVADRALEHGWIDVIAHRELARYVADATGVAHESPQALLVRDGEVVWDASHFDVTAAALAAAVGS